MQSKSRAERFKSFIIKNLISQRELASILDCSESFVSRMVNGKVTITLKTLYKIKKKIPSFDIDYVVSGKPSEKISASKSKSSVSSVSESSESMLKKEIELRDQIIKLKDARIAALEKELREEKQDTGYGENGTDVVANNGNHKVKRNSH